MRQMSINYVNVLQSMSLISPQNLGLGVGGRAGRGTGDLIVDVCFDRVGGDFNGLTASWKGVVDRLSWKLDRFVGCARCVVGALVACCWLLVAIPLKLLLSCIFFPLFAKIHLKSCTIALSSSSTLIRGSCPNNPMIR